MTTKPCIPEILTQLIELRQQLPKDRSRPLPANSTWLYPPAEDDRLCWALAQAGAILIEIDADARILFVSPNVEQISGFRQDEFLGLYVGDRVHPDDLARLVDVSRAMGEGAAPDHPRIRVKRKDSSWVHLEAVSASRFLSRDGSIHSVIVLCDVTERQEAWAALRESEERYRVISEASRDAILEIDEQRRVTFATGVARDVMGVTKEELSRMSPLEIVHPEDCARVEAQLREAFCEGHSVEIKPFRIQRGDDHWIWYECTGLSYERADGESCFLAVGRDVTDRLVQEREQHTLEVCAQQRQRLESLGVLAGGIAHDFNNLLTPILGESSLALADLPEDSPLRERLERIQRAARRAAKLTQQMLTNAGAETPRAELLDLSEIADDMARLVVGSPAEVAEVGFELASDPPRIRGDATQLGQIVTNLVTNAIESLEGSPGSVSIRTGETELRAAQLADVVLPAEPLPPGRYVYFEVEDTGTGMDEATRARIFDPFFTTKFTGRGLGLAAVIGIVRGHEGGIELETAPGDGTRFRVLFPAADTAESTAGRRIPLRVAAPAREARAEAGKPIAP